MNKPRIYADFNKWTGSGKEHWLILRCTGTFDDLRRLGLVLEDGLEAIFYADDADDDGTPDEIEANGVVRFDSVYGWVAVVDEDKTHHASDRIMSERSDAYRPDPLD